MVVLFGLFQVKTALWCAAVAVKPAGAAGLGSAGLAAVDSSDATPSPVAFTARTWNMYSTPCVRPLTV